ncbi:hypothetical protein D3C87_2017540 [compost metagenome]
MLIYRTGKTDDAKYAGYRQQLTGRLDSLWDTEPLNYRRQNAGDYEIPALTLRPDLAKGKTGLRIHFQESE